MRLQRQSLLWLVPLVVLTGGSDCGGTPVGKACKSDGECPVTARCGDKGVCVDLPRVDASGIDRMRPLLDAATLDRAPAVDRTAFADGQVAHDAGVRVDGAVLDAGVSPRPRAGVWQGARGTMRSPQHTLELGVGGPQPAGTATGASARGEFGGLGN